MSCESRIEKAIRKGVELPLNRFSRYVIFGDCHRGVGNMGDNFLRNQPLFSAALEYYNRRKFCYLELGDGEELWENRSLDKIRECHEDVYEKFHELQRENRFYKIYGNHDMELRNHLPESIFLNNQEGGRKIYIIHGHQADFFNSVCWRVSRFLVRYVWRPLELFGVNDPTSAAKNYKKTQKYENCMAEMAKKKDVYLLAGHSHRPRLMMGELYINAGSCVHPKSITAIEIENMRVSLVKWFVGTKWNGELFVERQVIQGEIPVT